MIDISRSQTNTTIMGLDIAKGSPRSKEPAGYAVAVLKNDSIERHGIVSRHKLIRLIKEESPLYLAIDNIYELASSRRDLVSFLQKLPYTTKLVQVTGAEQPVALTKLAHDHGIAFNRLDPFDEARVCAQLVGIRVGFEVQAFEDRTLIKVSRARSPGKGGWSQNRYRRKIHGAVRDKARHIEEKLNSDGLK